MIAYLLINPNIQTMDDEAKKILTELMSNLINQDQGTNLTLKILVLLLIENGTLAKERILEQIDEAYLKFERENINEYFSEPLLSLGNSISPGRYTQSTKDMLAFLNNWKPSGNKH